MATTTASHWNYLTEHEIASGYTLDDAKRLAHDARQLRTFARRHAEAVRAITAQPIGSRNMLRRLQEQMLRDQYNAQAREAEGKAREIRAWFRKLGQPAGSEMMAARIDL